MFEQRYQFGNTASTRFHLKMMRVYQKGYDVSKEFNIGLRYRRLLGVKKYSNGNKIRLKTLRFCMNTFSKLNPYDENDMNKLKKKYQYYKSLREVQGISITRKTYLDKICSELDKLINLPDFMHLIKKLGEDKEKGLPLLDE